MSEDTETRINRLDLIAQWNAAAAKLKEAKLSESELRMEMFNEIFPEPKVGTNTYGLPNDWKLKMTHGFNYSVEEAKLPAFKDTFEGEDISTDLLIKRKPELAKSEYNKLTAQQKKVFDNVLIKRPATPGVEIVPPPKAK